MNQVAQKVLVVEDEESIASFVSMYLKKGGFAVAVAGTGLTPWRGRRATGRR